jgi:hypothetical protein
MSPFSISRYPNHTFAMKSMRFVSRLPSHVMTAPSSVTLVLTNSITLPIECRQHRRKCNLYPGESRCERCKKQNLKCEFKYYKPAKGGSNGKAEFDVSEMNANVEYLERQVQELELAIQGARAQMDISPNTSSMEYEDIPVFAGDTPYNDSLFEFKCLDFKEKELNQDYSELDNTLALMDGRGTFRNGSTVVEQFLLTPSSAISDISHCNSESSESSQDLVLFSPISSEDDKDDQNDQHTWSITVCDDHHTFEVVLLLNFVITLDDQKRVNN